MSDRYNDITAAGGRVVAVSIDSPEQNAAMVEKLHLPFPFLSDPDRNGAISPYGVADLRDPRRLALPAVFVVAPNGELVFGEVSRDYADRAPEEAAIEALAGLGLPGTAREKVACGPSDPGPRAMPRHAMEPYFRGAKFAVTAMRMRHPDTADDAAAFIAQMDRYISLVRALQEEN